MQHANKIKILILGSNDLAIASYQSLVKNLQHELKKGLVEITIISNNKNYECLWLMGESIGNIVAPETLCRPLFELAKHATVIEADVLEINTKAHEVCILKTGGSKESIHYNHLVLGSQWHTISRNNHIPGLTYSLTNITQAVLVQQQMQLLVKQAASAGNELMAKNQLRMIIVIDDESKLGLAANMANYLSGLCRQYPALEQVKPQCILVSENDKCLQAKQPDAIKKYTSQQLQLAGVSWMKDGRLSRICPDGVVMDNGSFIAGNLVVFTSEVHIPYPGTSAFTRHSSGAFANDKFLRVAGQNFTWCQDHSNAGNGVHPLQMQRQGSLIGKNIAHAIRCQFLETYTPKAKPFCGNLQFGKAYFSKNGIIINGGIACCINLVGLLMAIPLFRMRTGIVKSLVSHVLRRKTPAKSWPLRAAAIPAQPVISAAAS